MKKLEQRLVLYPGDYIFEKLNSEFSLDFQGIFKIFPEQLNRKKSTGIHFRCDYVRYFTFSLSFPGFSYKNSNFS